MWSRYIGHIFSIWTHDEEDSCITFTYDSNKKGIVFLDIKLITDVYVKPSDRYQYLHYSSAHPYHTKKSVVLGQTLWVSRLCSSKKDFENHKEGMKPWFKEREYLEHLSSSGMRNFKFSNLRLKSNDKIKIRKGYHQFLLIILCWSLLM